MEDFIYRTYPEKVVFGHGKKDKVRTEMEEWGVKRVLIISTPGRQEIANDISEQLKELCVGIFDKAVQHVPQENVKEVIEVIREKQADALVAIGGGSAIGLAKAAVLERGLRILAVPTTYSGSEMTPVWGITNDEKKQTGNDPVVKPQTVIYDPDLTKSMPPHLSLTSGVNAMAHCVEGLYASQRNPVISMLAEEGIRALFKSLGNIVTNPTDIEARSYAFYGSWLAGSVLGSVDMALHHKLCHALGGICNLPHSETHTVILSHVISYNASHAKEALDTMARAIGTEAENVSQGIFKLAAENGGPTTLAELGMEKYDIENVATYVSSQSFSNPRDVTKAEIQSLLEKAFGE